jgi:HEAT repeat protein
MRVVTLLFAFCFVATSSFFAQPPADVMQMLKSPKANARRIAAESLGKQKKTEAIPALAELLKDDDEGVREAAIGALGQIGAPAASALGAALEYPREDSRMAALRALRQLGPDAKAATAAIATALKDKNIDIRIQAADALGAMKSDGKAALPALFAAAKDISIVTSAARLNLAGSVAEAAITAALEIDSNCAADLAKAVLPDLEIGLQSKDDTVVQAAANALARLGQTAKAALPALEKAYKRATATAVENTLSAAILAVGGEGTPLLAELANDANAPLAKRLTALYQLGVTPNVDDRVVAALVHALRDQEPQVKAGAAMAVAMIGPRAKGAIPDLIELLADEKLDEAADKVSAGASKVSCQALARIGPDAVPALTSLLKDASKPAFARWQAAGTLANLGRRAKPALSILEATMKDSDLLVAGESACAYVLAGGDAANAVPVLIVGLKVKNSHVLWHTADAVRRVGSKAKDTVPLLTALLKHQDREVRIAAAHALASIGPAAKPSVPAMAQLLQKNDPRQRLQVILALQRLGPDAKAAIPALIQRLRDMEPMNHHPLLITLGEFGPDARDAVPALVDLLKRKDIVFHLDAMDALGQIGPAAQAAVTPLQGFLSSPSEYPRAHAARALGGIGSKAWSAVPALKKLQKDNNLEVRVWAAYALARAAGDAKPHVAELIELWKANPNDDDVRQSIAQAFDLLGRDARPAKEILLEALTNEKTTPGTHLYVARALGHMSDDAGVVVPKLVELLSGKSAVNCVHACQALGLLGPRAKEAIPRLRELTENDDDEIAAAAGWALGKIEAK